MGKHNDKMNIPLDEEVFRKEHKDVYDELTSLWNDVDDLKKFFNEMVENERRMFRIIEQEWGIKNEKTNV